jgi:hypothetical protein
LGSFKWLATHSVVTRTSGFAYSLILFPPSEKFIWAGDVSGRRLPGFELPVGV